MIKNKADLRRYISEDERVCGYPFHHSLIEYFTYLIFPDRNLQFLRCLRHLEYNINGGGYFRKFLIFFYMCRYAHLRSITGIEISPNCVGAGFHIPHGKVVVNSTAKIGDNCKIMSDVTIGAHGSYGIKGAPQIGDRVFIGTGARILGKIRIANDVVIGANTVVTKDILEPGTTWVGIPARKIADKGSAQFLRLPNNTCDSFKHL
jgi:serine O-acetyltransferase